VTRVKRKKGPESKLGRHQFKKPTTGLLYLLKKTRIWFLSVLWFL
jgi:hypothetical protein